MCDEPRTGKGQGKVRRGPQPPMGTCCRPRMGQGCAATPQRAPMETRQLWGSLPVPRHSPWSVRPLAGEGKTRKVQGNAPGPEAAPCRGLGLDLLPSCPRMWVGNEWREKEGPQPTRVSSGGARIQLNPPSCPPPAGLGAGAEAVKMCTSLGAHSLVGGISGEHGQIEKQRNEMSARHPACGDSQTRCRRQEAATS